MRFGIREICDVVLRAKSTMTLGSRKFYKDEPVLYFDTLKTSSLEGASTTVYATGGRGNTRLVAWEGERTLTFTMEDALISPESFSILSGAGLMTVDGTAPIYVHTTSQVEVKEDNIIVLPESACWNKYEDDEDPYYKDAADIFVMVMKDGEIDAEPCIPDPTYDGSSDHKTFRCYGHTGTIKKGTIVLVDYYVKRTGGAQVIEITADKFGGNYYLEASTLFRRESDGVDMPAEFIIPNCKVQSNFTFSMAATGDPSTFTFTMDAFPDYTKFDKTHKVLAAIQVITDESGEEDESRESCYEHLPTGEDAVSVAKNKLFTIGDTRVKTKDLMDDDVQIAWVSETEGAVYGTLKYISDFEAFSSNKTEQSGNYFALMLDEALKDKEITTKKNGAVSKTGIKDLEWILRIENIDTTFTFEADGEKLFTLDFKSATLEEAPVVEPLSTKASIKPNFIDD